jgi:hypothetical protein
MQKRKRSNGNRLAARTILEIYADKHSTYEELAAKHRCSISTIASIKRGRTNCNLTGAPARGRAREQKRIHPARLAIDPMEG